jgi:hypothetical protein
MFLETANGGRLGIGTSNPNSTLQVNGGLAYQRTYVANTSHTTNNETIIGVSTSTAAVTVTLSTADRVAGRIVIIKDEDGVAGTCNITVTPQTATPAAAIDGAANKIINTNYGSIRVYSNGSNWFTF